MKKHFTDQLNRPIHIERPPKRIVSLVPSQTELLYDLGIDESLVGITRFCIHPKHFFENKTKVGGTKNYRLDKIRALQPDFILANKEENDKESLLALAKEFPVWISDIENLVQAKEMILAVGDIVDKNQQATEIVKQIEEGFLSLKNTRKPKTACYLIWQKPFMTINQSTFIHDMLWRAGFENVFKNKPARYPEISLEEIQEKQPEYVLLSSEPYPFEQKHLEWFQKHLPKSNVKIVDGECFSWYGSKLLHSAAYFKTLN